jgi:hypothetical protein
MAVLVGSRREVGSSMRREKYEAEQQKIDYEMQPYQGAVRAARAEMRQVSRWRLLLGSEWVEGFRGPRSQVRRW